MWQTRRGASSHTFFSLVYTYLCPSFTFKTRNQWSDHNPYRTHLLYIRCWQNRHPGLGFWRQYTNTSKNFQIIIHLVVQSIRYSLLPEGYLLPPSRRLFRRVHIFVTNSVGFSHRQSRTHFLSPLVRVFATLQSTNSLCNIPAPCWWQAVEFCNMSGFQTPAINRGVSELDIGKQERKEGGHYQQLLMSQQNSDTPCISLRRFPSMISAIWWKNATFWSPEALLFTQVLFGF